MKPLKEIEASRPLQWLAASFSLVHVVIFFSGIYDDWWIPHFLSREAVPICSALFPDCWQYRFSFHLLQWLWCFYGLLACLAVALFIFKKVRQGYFLLLALLVFELFLTFSDYRLWYSHFYISSSVLIAFLFFSPQPLMSALILALCYWWAGWLKVNPHWMTGELLQAHWKIFPQFLPLQADFVIFMELVLVGLLFSKRPKFFWPTFVIFVIFHIFSWHIVGYFYPLLMFCLLPVFLVNYWWPKISWKALLRTKNIIFLGAFCLLQIPPYLTGETAYLWGGGRMFYSLHMYHRHIVCRTQASYLENGTMKTIQLVDVSGEIAVRLACEPLVSFNIAKYLCRTRNLTSPLHVEHWAKFENEGKERQIYSVDDFCHKDLQYHFFGWNSWMNKIED